MQDTKEVFKAWLNGEKIQFRLSTEHYWNEVIDEASFKTLCQLVADGSWQFRIKPETKIVKYQTRLYSVGRGLNTSIYEWNSLSSLHRQEYLKEESSNLKWLQPTQEHTFEYEETE